MISRFESHHFLAQIDNGSLLAPCQSPERRLEQCQALALDMAQLLCGLAADLGFLVSKGSQSALVLGVSGSRRRPALTLELTRRRQRCAYLLFSDPLLGIADADGLPACATSNRTTSREQLHIHQLEGSRADLVEMRRLLAKKLNVTAANWKPG